MECISIDENHYKEQIDKKVKDLYRTKKNIETRKEKLKFNPIFLLIGSIVGSGFYALVSLDIYGYRNWSEIIFIGSFLGGVLYLFVIFYANLILDIQMNKIERELIACGASELQENIEEDFFNRLVKINFKYLDQYYMQTKEQANKSFLFTSIASIIGLGIVCSGIVMVFMEKTTPGYLAACSGVIIEFVSAIFFYLYNKTVVKMGQYHKKLVLSQNISLALKITEEFDDSKKFDSRMIIINELIKDINKNLTDEQ